MVKVIWRRLRNMEEVTRAILRGGLLVTSAALLGSFIVSLAAAAVGTYYLWDCAAAMRDMAPGLLLIAVIGSAMAESRAKAAG